MREDGVRGWSERGWSEKGWSEWVEQQNSNIKNEFSFIGL